MRVIVLIFLGVVMLLCGFAALGVGPFSRSSGSPDAAIPITDSDLDALESALESYREIGGVYPSSEQGLQALVIKPQGEPRPLRWAAGLLELPTDPWGHPFQYHYPGRVNPQKPEIVSAGPDRQFGTVDDLSSQD